MRPVILVVEDQIPVRRAIARMLRGEGWQVAEAAAELDACGLIAGGELDAVLTDLHLGAGGSGRVVAEAARIRRVPCVTMTGSAVPADLQKPFEVGELLAALERVLVAPTLAFAVMRKAEAR
jgi:CheY-like chemotaxis protein